MADAATLNVVDDELNKWVSWTARLVAAHRALETDEPDSILKDPLAKAFAGSKATDFVLAMLRDNPEKSVEIWASAPPKEPGRKRRIGPFVVRPKCLDDIILASCGMKGANSSWVPANLCSEPIQQVVVLGAGLDARAWRLPLPSAIKWFEVDQAEVLAVKQKVLHANGAPLDMRDNSSARIPVRVSQVIPVAADLKKSGWLSKLSDAGFDCKQLVHWHAEGLFMYLSPEDVRVLLTEASQACKTGSLLTADILPEQTMAEQAKRHVIKNTHESFRLGFGAPMPVEKFEEFLGECGWKVVSHVEMDDVAHQITQGLEYNQYPRPEGRGWYVSLGVFRSCPSTIKRQA